MILILSPAAISPGRIKTFENHFHNNDGEFIIGCVGQHLGIIIKFYPFMLIFIKLPLNKENSSCKQQ